MSYKFPKKIANCIVQIAKVKFQNYSTNIAKLNSETLLQTLQRWFCKNSRVKTYSGVPFCPPQCGAKWGTTAKCLQCAAPSSFFRIIFTFFICRSVGSRSEEIRRWLSRGPWVRLRRVILRAEQEEVLLQGGVPSNKSHRQMWPSWVSHLSTFYVRDVI